ncbi:eugenol O-methyltransferase family protein [Dorcoceras hygrometricum]|uniref:Eugenol O-methyltransferase family protein n=1 Tax=Dorcoceras hygrometricum TaxID=472368 RepID=A0A2Z6ZZ88_9LAMI|nr:eugenol O-methyltransferase family protein [Dorcoceras hygrometricum]
MEKQHYSKHEQEDEAFVECGSACVSHVLRLVLDGSLQLGLFEIIGKSGDGAHLSSFDIASQLETCNVDRAASVLDSILRVLVSHSFLTCSKTEHEIRYGIAPKGKFFVADEGGVSMAPFFALTLQEESANWG